IVWGVEGVRRVPAWPGSRTHRPLWGHALGPQGVPVLDLPSGAGHDAVLLGGLVPISVLVVRCGNGGVGHNPQETMTAADAQLAGQAVLDFLQRFEDTLPRA